MKYFMKKFPVPLSGVMLSLVALGNLLQKNSRDIHWLCGGLALVLFVILTCKIIVCPEEIKAVLEDGKASSVLPTYSMTIMGISVYLKAFIGDAAYVVWWIGIILHLILVIRFTIKYVFHLDWNKVHATYFIGYAGIASIAITAPDYHMEKLGTVAFWIAISCVTVMLVIVTYRHFAHPVTQEEDRPLIGIYASPLSVCLTGYVHSVSPISYELLLVLYTAATICYLAALFQVPRFLKKTFYPSFSAFTFPFVIAATGASQAVMCLDEFEEDFLILHLIVEIQTAIAIALVLYTLIRFWRYIRMECFEPSVS